MPLRKEPRRERPQPWREFASDLAACVVADDRLVGSVMWGRAGAGDRAAEGGAQRFAAWLDRQLAVLARRLFGAVKGRSRVARWLWWCGGVSAWLAR